MDQECIVKSENPETEEGKERRGNVKNMEEGSVDYENVPRRRRKRSDEGFDEPDRKHMKLWPDSLDVDDGGKENNKETDEIETVSQIKTDHFDITKESNEAGQYIQISKNKCAYTDFDSQHRFNGTNDHNITENQEEEKIILHEQTIDTSCAITDSNGSYEQGEITKDKLEDVMEPKEEKNDGYFSTLTGSDDDERNSKPKKHEEDVYHICKSGVEYKTNETSGKHKLEILTGHIAEEADQDDSFHHDSEIKNAQNGNFADDTTESSETCIPVQVFSLAKTTTADDLSSPIKDNAILSSQNNQKEVVIYQNDDQHSRDTTESEEVPEDVEVKEDEYVYRLLRFNEYFWRGLFPKNIRSKTSIKEHVENGSKNGKKSRFISCCKTICGLKELASITNIPNRVRLVVRINIAELDPEEVNVIDLTDESVRLKYFKRNSRAWDFAGRFEEVILEPRKSIPRDCIEEIGTVQHQLFTKYEDITL